MPCAADRALQRYASRAVPGSLGQLKILASGISHGSLAANSLRNLLDQLPAESSPAALRSEEHTSELQSLMRISYAVFCLTKKTRKRADIKIDRTHEVNITHNPQI